MINQKYLSRLGLGTVQFGMDYGVTNDKGALQFDEISKIMSAANEEGIKLFDTAPAYGNSESLIGKCAIEKKRRIITKTPLLKQLDEEMDVAETVYSSVMNSIKCLGVKYLDGLLIHDVNDLFSHSAEVLKEVIQDLHEQGHVKKYGVSVYTPEQLDKVMDIWTPQIVQLPYNLFDQRFKVNGHISNLNDRKIEVHLRSIFLQGVLLENMENLPVYFRPLTQKMKDIESFVRDNNLSKLQLCLLSAFSISNAFVLVGITSYKQLMEIISSIKLLPDTLEEIIDCAVHDEKYINPSLWEI